MPAPFNTTNMTDPTDLLEYANLVTSPVGYHVFGDLMVLAVWVISLGVFQRGGGYETNNVLKALIAASFATFFFSGILDIVGLVDRSFVVLPFGVLAIGLFLDKMMEK